ncbi:hypothetical protein SDC9_112201 [bioreactor metagenome]|uniref:Uncharacterized protein n=1 Tax=bioreactor metagenome TaxID=1076179 RepID=A0A645BJD1_9ZZZZ
MAAGAGVVNGLGIQLLARSAFRFQQHRHVAVGDFLRQLLHSDGVWAGGHHVVKGISCAVGLIDAAQHLLASPLIGLQLTAEVMSLLHEGDHGKPADYAALPNDGIHIDKIDILGLHTGRVKNGLTALHHLGQAGARAQLPQTNALQ